MTMRIPIRARLGSTISSLKERMELYPAMKRSGYGSRLTYLVLPESEHELCLFHFSSDSIVMEIRSSANPADRIRQHVLRLLSVMAVLGDCYEAEMRDMYPYLIMAIGSHNLNHLAEGLHRSANACVSDIELARRINCLLSENSALASRAERLEKKMKLLIIKVLAEESLSRPATERNVAVKYGISEDEIRSALESCKGLGYKVERAGDGFYMVVA